MPRWSNFEDFLSDAQHAPSDAERQSLVNSLLAERTSFPWVESGTTATFIYTGDSLNNVSLNLDTIPHDPPFAPMTHLEGTNLWYVTRDFVADDLLDYLLAVNDPLTPLAQETDILSRVTQHWQPDPRNPLHLDAAQQTVSVLQMPNARPFPDWYGMRRVTRGAIHELTIDSDELGFTDRRLSIYTPPGYESSDLAYPLLILQDGQWATGALQVPAMADALTKHQRMQPTIIAMIQSGAQDERNREYTSPTGYPLFLLTELLPVLQSSYRIDSSKIGVGGVALGAVAAAGAALQNPSVFSRLIMISPPLGKGAYQEHLRELMTRFERSDQIPARIFHSVGRYEAKARFVRPAQNLDEILTNRRDTEHRFIQLGTGHGLVGFRNVLPEALAWTFPGANT